MSCEGFDIRDYFLGELPELERSEASRHLSTCEECAGELDQLRFLTSALQTLPEEEPPQRIGFVSDKVFEPSPVRRWWNSFWLSGARMGFASAAMLSVALLVSAWRQPAVTVVETRAVAASVAAAPVDLQPLVEAATRKAVALAMAEQEKKTQALLATAERKHDQEQKAQNLQVEAAFEKLQKRYMLNRAVALNYEGGQQ